MKIILRTYTSDPYGDNYANCECAVVTVDDQLLKTIRERIAAAQSARELSPELCELHFRGGCAPPAFYDYSLVEACEEVGTDVLAGETCTLPNEIDLAKFEPQKNDCDLMVVCLSQVGGETKCEVNWCKNLEYSNLTLSTAEVSLEWLEARLAGERVSG